jgi:hypothetical protein
MPDMRTETDSLGVIEVPADKPWVLRYNVRSSQLPDAPWRSELCGWSDWRCEGPTPLDHDMKGRSLRNVYCATC